MKFCYVRCNFCKIHEVGLMVVTMASVLCHYDCNKKNMKKSEPNVPVFCDRCEYEFDQYYNNP